MHTTEIALTDETGGVTYVDPCTVAEAPRTTTTRGLSDDDKGLAFITLFTVVALVSMWVFVIHAVH
jgi:hypothetical protein